MRILSVTVASLIASLIIFLTIKFWGLSQPYIEYKHAFFTTEQTPVVFYDFQFKLNKDTTSSENESLKTKFIEILNKPESSSLYLNLAITKDQKLVLIGEVNTDKIKFHQHDYTEIKNQVFLATDFAQYLQNKKIIFNITENAMAGHEIFIDFIKEMKIEKTEQILITSPYDVMVSAIKDLAPTQVYGTSQPEILKIKALESLYLIEAANFRADAVIHPLLTYKQPFYTETLLTEMKRRFKKIIIGPLHSETEEMQARKFNPFGIINKINLN